MAFELPTVTAFIKNLSITATMPAGGTQALVIRDYADIFDQTDQRAGPVLQPDLTRPVIVQRIEYDSFGSGLTAKMTLRYSVPYALLYWPVGQVTLPTVANIWPGMVLTVKAISTAIIANIDPSNGGSTVQLFLEAATLGQTVNSPGGANGGEPHHGVLFTFGVMEFVN